MEEQKICQSCGKKLIKPEDFGTNQDGSINEDYCRQCFNLEQFTDQTITRNLIQQKIAQRLITEDGLSTEKALVQATEIVNHLKRWGLPQPKTIIYYYSKTGNSKFVAEIATNLLKADLEEIKETNLIDLNKPGDHFKLGGLSLLGKIIPVENIKNLPADYQLVIIISPIWGFSVPFPIRSFLNILPKEKKKLLLILTYGGMGAKRTFKQLNKILANFDLLGELAIQSPQSNPKDSEKIIKNFLAKSLR